MQGGSPKAWDQLAWNREMQNSNKFTNDAMQSVKNVTKPMEKQTEKAHKKNSKIANLQLQLWNSGAFKGVIDKKTGKQVTYQRAIDGMMGKMTRQAIENNKKRRESIQISQPQQQKEQKPQQRGGLASLYEMTHAVQTGGMNRIPQSYNKEIKYYSEINPEDMNNFAKWLYEKGSKSHLGNFTDVTSALARNFTGLGFKINPGEGTKQQALALHLLDRDDIKQNNDTITHYLGYIKGNDKYKWQQLNGEKNVHDNRGLYERASKTPGEFLLGRFTMKETPDKYWIDNETYNFNNSGTDFAYNKIKSGNATAYDKIKHIAGTYGVNKDIPVELEIPKEQVLAWYNQYKNQ